MELFNAVTDGLKMSTDYGVVKQVVALAMHVRSGTRDLRRRMSDPVRDEKLAQAQMYGVSMYREDSSWVIDKSLRYDGHISLG